MTHTLEETTIGFGTMTLCITADRPSEADASRMIQELIEAQNLVIRNLSLPPEALREMAAVMELPAGHRFFGNPHA